jgi:hypothetical protein
MRRLTGTKGKEGGALFIEEKVVPGLLLFLILDGIHFVDSRTIVGRISTEGDFEILEKSIHACQQRLRSDKNKNRS